LVEPKDQNNGSKKVMKKKPSKLTKKNFDGLEVPDYPTVEEMKEQLAIWKEEREK
jgi:hypothetical protein